MYLALPAGGRAAVRCSVYEATLISDTDGTEALAEQWRQITGTVFNAAPAGYVTALQNARPSDIEGIVDELLHSMAPG